MAKIDRLRRAVGLLGAALLHVAAAGAAEPKNAPLPAGYPSAASAEYVNGMFVHATFENWGFSAASQGVINATKACRDKGREPTGLALPQIYGNEEHWLYRTDSELVLFTRSYDARIDVEACKFEPVEVRTVTRRPVTSGALEWPSRFDGESRACQRKEVCKRRSIAGMRARCWGLSSWYAGSMDCVSISRATEGMTLSADFWSDDGQFEAFKVVTVQVNARIDRAVFAAPDRWKVAQRLSVRCAAGRGPARATDDNPRDPLPAVPQPRCRVSDGSARR